MPETAGGSQNMQYTPVMTLVCCRKQHEIDIPYSTVALSPPDGI